MKNIMSLETSSIALSNHNPEKVVDYSVTLFDVMEKVISGKSQMEKLFIPTTANCICAILTQFGLEVERDVETEIYHTTMRRNQSIHISFDEGRENTEIRVYTDSWLDLRELRLAFFAFKAKKNLEAHNNRVAAASAE